MTMNITHKISRPVAAILGLVIALTLPSAAAANDKNVVLFIEDPGKFEVLHSRAQSTSTGAVLFGLIGAGIEEANRKDKDEEKEEAILVHIPDDACHSYLVDAFTVQLEKKGFGVTVNHAKVGKTAGDAYAVRLKIDACGFRIVDSIDDEVAAYVVAQYRIFKPQEKTSGKLEELTMIGRDHRPWEDFQVDFDGAVNEFRSVKSRAGTRLANKVIYTK